MYVADLGMLAWFDYKYRGAYRVLFFPCWVAMILAGLRLIHIVTLFYALELAVVTLGMLFIGLRLRRFIGDGDIWLLIGLIWCFATSPVLLFGTAIGTIWLAFRWPDAHAVPLATCLALALGAVLPITFMLRLYTW